MTVENAGGAGDFVILCDHASNFIPTAYAGLGLGDAERQAHIAWDPGALPVARALAEKLDAPLVAGRVSRLVIDLNRTTDAPDLIPTRSEATAVPGNEGLGEAERQRRIRTIHEPYHVAIEALIGRRLVDEMPTALIAIHSFTAVYNGRSRPWDIGILFDRDRRLADRLLDALRAEDGLMVGANEPYSPADGVYHTLSVHGERRGLPTAMIEIRNDVIRSEAEQERWADRLADILAGGSDAQSERPPRQAVSPSHPRS